jgi:hypothetical protein
MACTQMSSTHQHQWKIPLLHWGDHQLKRQPHP